MQPRRDGFRIFATAFALALVGYVVLFYAIERRRPKGGPWVVTFNISTNGTSCFVIDQHRLGISNVQVCLTLTNRPATNSSRTLRFDTARAVPFDLPFGQCIFQDTTFLPGTVTLQVANHEVELLPRVLIINHREHRWAVNERIELNQAADAMITPP